MAFYPKARLNALLSSKPNNGLVITSKVHPSSWVVTISGVKKAMYWICRPCKNNRHDLCVRQTSGRAASEPKVLCWCSLQPTHQARQEEPYGENAKRLPYRQPLSRE